MKIISFFLYTNKKYLTRFYNTLKKTIFFNVLIENVKKIG